MFNLTYLIYIFVIFISTTDNFDLTSYNISTNYYVSSVATYGSRIFVALPRTSCYNNINDPTLLEVSWFNGQQNLFAKKKPFFMESQQWNNCEHLQDAISLDMETMRSRLWVLDKGNLNCPAKIVVFNLFQKINYSLDTPDVPKDKLNYLVVDVDVKFNGPRAYIGLDGLDYLLVFSLSEFKWWQINLHSSNENQLTISTKFIAFSRKEAILYITGEEERGIFSLNLTLLRKEITEEADNFNRNIMYLGEKLGASSALVADLKNGLSYYLPRDYVVIRWDTRNPSQAEYYNILAQSHEQLPYVSQLYTGPQNGIWALVNLGPINNCDTEPTVLKRRLIKILKYNVLM